MTNPTSIDPLILERIENWLSGPYDAESKAEIRKKLHSNPQYLIDAFFTDLSFGTGGMRGLMGVGTNRINRYTIQSATQGLANYLLSQKTSPSVFIGFDSRHHSAEFAQEAACVLAGNGIHVHLLPQLRPTPYISFGCRYKQCDAAIMITASHNPKEYNGYKIYGHDGAQVVHPHDTGILQEVKKITDPSQVKIAPLTDPHIEIVDLSLDIAYLKAIEPFQHFRQENHQGVTSLAITYTSLHGTGATMIPSALKNWGFTSIHLVDEQIQPDGNFPTTPFPNPEHPQSLELGIQKMIATQSDLLIATDPDADRVGIVAMHHHQPYVLNGNQTAALCVDYLCEILTHQPQSAFITTIVTTELIKIIAQANQFQCIEVLTGFKYIGEKIHEWEIQPSSPHFIFGAEESYGYLLGTVSRDKDAIITSCLIAEMALYTKRQNLTLIDRLYHIYNRYGVHKEKQYSIDFPPGKKGMDRINQIMSHLRQQLPQTIGSIKIVAIEDYLISKKTDLTTQHKEPLHLPQSDVLVFYLENTRLIIRPSGTEPKIKIYASTSQKTTHTNLTDTQIEQILNECENSLDSLMTHLKSIIDLLPN